MSKIDPSMGVQDLVDKSGVLFGRVFGLPDGGNMAIVRTQENGRAGFSLYMNALGIQSISKMESRDGPELNNAAVGALIGSVSQDRAEKMHSALSKTLRERAPQLTSLYEVRKLMSDFGMDSMGSPVIAKIHEHEGQKFLAIRGEISPPESLLDTTSVIHVFGESVQETFKFASSQDRDATFSSSERMVPLLSPLADRQVGNELLSSSSTARRPKTP